MIDKLWSSVLEIQNSEVTAVDEEAVVVDAEAIAVDEEVSAAEVINKNNLIRMRPLLKMLP